jgi:glycosyltransferase involved in cell wall biosynthesis
MHISTRLILGGSQENTVLSCEGQADRGHTLSLVYGPIFGPEGSLHDRARAHGGIELIETPHLAREISPVTDLRCRGDLRRLIRAWKPDVVHTHSSKAGILGRAAAWAEHAPCVVHTVHGPPFHRYESKWRNALYIASERYAAKRCDHIVCVADAMRGQFTDARIGRADQYSVIYSGMEVEPFLAPPTSRETLRAEFGLAPDDFVIGTVARLAELKGHDDLLDALGGEMKRNSRMKLLWVGDGWWKDRLLGRVRDEGLAAQVVTTGLVPPSRIPSLMQAMDLLAHPSYREGLPRAVVQGLLSGLPAVAYDCDGAGEVCISGRTGTLVPAGDRARLRDAVLELMHDPHLARRLGAQGREFCRNRFAAATMVQQLLALYESILQRSG